ncbi:hypothetical protein BH23GEM6_BH23GEM6_11310 [soil metagenome]
MIGRYLPFVGDLMNPSGRSNDGSPSQETGGPTQEDLQTIRARLTSERARLASRVARDEAELEQHRRAVGERAPCAFLSPAAAVQDAEQEVRARMSGQTRHDLEVVEEALQRLSQDAASFGRCDRCGGDISAARLDILPQATICEGCLESQT